MELLEKFSKEYLAIALSELRAIEKTGGVGLMFDQCLFDVFENAMRDYGEVYSLNRAITLLEALATTWPKYSGDPAYPVRDWTKETWAYRQFYDCQDFWNTLDPYGELWWEFLLHCIKEIEKALKSAQKQGE